MKRYTARQAVADRQKWAFYKATFGEKRPGRFASTLENSELGLEIENIAVRLLANPPSGFRNSLIRRLMEIGNEIAKR